jgi:hypothetical protein
MLHPRGLKFVHVPELKRSCSLERTKEFVEFPDRCLSSPWIKPAYIETGFQRSSPTSNNVQILDTLLGIKQQ